jgi:hypothetical protein
MYENYSIKRERGYGHLLIVRHNGVKIGSTQTEAAAKILRRRHYTRNNKP